MTENLLLLTDSYKASHFKQYPPGTTNVYSYFESRGGQFDETVFFGLQYLIKKYLQGNVITQAKIDEADAFFTAHMGIFNRAGWERLLEKHGGRLPILIRAVPEGTVVPAKNVLFTVENTDPEFPWLTNYIETLLVQMWYPTTVATLSREAKKTIAQYLALTGDPGGISFKLHDFGFRGVSSVESAMIGGAAHLVNFMGSDTVAGIMMLRDYYHEPMAAFSIPAAEHSTITSWGLDNEVDAFDNMLTQFPKGLVAVVSDSRNIFEACDNLWGVELKEKVLARDGVLVVRPDSGDPASTVLKVVEILADRFGFTTNSKGFKVLNPKVRVIQGDGINLESITEILDTLFCAGFSADNIAFGMGGALLQQVNRDTNNFALKCSSIIVNGEQRDVYKQPVGSKMKVSKRGRLKLAVDGPSFATVSEGAFADVPDAMVSVFHDGVLLVDQKLADVRARASIEPKALNNAVTN